MSELLIKYVKLRFEMGFRYKPNPVRRVGSYSITFYIVKIRARDITMSFEKGDMSESEQLHFSSDYFDDDGNTPPLRLVDTYRLGTNIEYLQHISKATNEGYLQDNSITASLEQISQILERANFESNVEAEARTILEKLSPHAAVDDEELDTQILENISDRAHAWERVIVEELKRQKVVSVDNSGFFDVNQLVSHPESLFSKPVWDWLDERPQNDLIEACRNLAIGSSTSPVILSLRAVEHCLRRWYEIEKDEELSVAWGGVLDQLMEDFVDSDKQNATLLDQLSDLPAVLSNLYYLKEKRNEVNHPDRSPSIHESQRTLMIVVSTITEIHAEVFSETYYDSVEIDAPDEYDDNQELVLDLIWKIHEESPDGRVPKDAVYEAGGQLGLSKERIGSAIMDNLMSGQMYEPDSDHFVPI